MRKNDTTTIIAKDDKQSVQTAFDNFFAKPGPTSALLVLYVCARQMMVDYPVKTINLGFEKISCSAYYHDNNIVISLKNLKRCKKPEQLVDLLISLFHEYSHRLVEENNKLFLETQSKNSTYLQPYYDGMFYNFFTRILDGDIELASACSMYYYYFNKNEDLARQFSSEITQKFVDEFCLDKNLNVHTHKDLNNKVKKGLMEISKDFYYNQELPIMVLDGFQEKFISKLSDSITDRELKDFLLSCELRLTPKARKSIIDFCIKTEEYEVVKQVLAKPQIKVTQDELKALNNIFGKDKIKKFVFGEAKILNDKQLSK